MRSNKSNSFLEWIDLRDLNLRDDFDDVVVHM